MLLENISLLETWKYSCKKSWAIIFISLFSFLGGHLSTHSFQYLEHLSIFSTLFFSFFMNNFCIAQCFFATTKILRDSNKNMEHLFGGYPIKHIFGVHYQCRSKTFLGGSRCSGMVLCLPPMQE